MPIIEPRLHKPWITFISYALTLTVGMWGNTSGAFAQQTYEIDSTLRDFENAVVNELLVTREGDFVLAGSQLGQGGAGGRDRDAMVLKIAADGDLIWSFRSGIDADDTAQAVAELGNGGLIVVGSRDSQGQLIPTTLHLNATTGAAVWDREYREFAQSKFSDVAALSAGEILTIVSGDMQPATDARTGFALVLDEAGENLREFSLGRTGAVLPQAAFALRDGQIFVAGGIEFDT